MRGGNEAVTRGTYDRRKSVWRRLVKAGEIPPEPEPHPAPRIRVNPHIPGSIVYKLFGGLYEPAFSDGLGRGVARPSAAASAVNQTGNNGLRAADES